MSVNSHGSHATTMSANVGARYGAPVMQPVSFVSTTAVPTLPQTMRTSVVQMQPSHMQASYGFPRVLTRDSLSSTVQSFQPPPQVMYSTGTIRGPVVPTPVLTNASLQSMPTAHGYPITLQPPMPRSAHTVGIKTLYVGYQVMQQQHWMNAILSRLWGPICLYISETMKQTLHGQNVFLDADVDAAIYKILQLPLQLPLTSEWINRVLNILRPIIREAVREIAADKLGVSVVPRDVNAQDTTELPNMQLPITCEMINTLILFMWPLIAEILEDMVKQVILPKLRAKLPSFLQSVDMNPCTVGKTPPKVKSIKALPNAVSGGWLDLQIDLEYDGDVDMQLVYGGLSVGIRAIKFEATLFVSFHGHLSKPPFFEGLSMYLCKMLHFGMDWTGVCDFLDNEFIEDLIHKIAGDMVGKMCVLPNRIPIMMDTSEVGGIFNVLRPKPRGVLKVTVVKAEGLVGTEYDIHTLFGGKLSVDPFVSLNIGPEKWFSKSVQNSCDPTWDEDNTHLFLVDVPFEQNIFMHVWDEDLLTKQRLQLTGEAEEEVARAMPISILDLLERGSADDLRQEIRIEKTGEKAIDLLSWWPGRGMGPEAEDFSSLRKEEKQHANEGGVLSWMRNKVAGSGIPGSSVGAHVLSWVKDTMAARKEKHEKEEKQHLLEARAKLHIIAEWRPVDFGPRMAPTSVRLAPGALSAQMPVAGMPTTFSTLPQVGTTNIVMPSTEPQTGMMRLAPPAVMYRAPESQPTSPLARQMPAAVTPQSDPGWPSFILLVGISKLDRLNITADDEDTLTYHAKVQATPVMNGDGKIFKESDDQADQVTTQTSTECRPKKIVQPGEKEQDKTKALARKIGLCLKSKMPVDNIADVLDVDQETVYKLLQTAIVETQALREVDIVQVFTYFLQDPAPVVVNIEFFSKKEKNERSLGTFTVNVGALLHKDAMTHDVVRVPLDGAPSGSSPRLTAQLKLWPIVKFCSP